MCVHDSAVVCVLMHVRDSAVVRVLTCVCVLLQTHMATGAQTFSCGCVHTHIHVCAGPGVPTTCDSVVVCVLTCAVILRGPPNHTSKTKDS